MKLIISFTVVTIVFFPLRVCACLCARVCTCTHVHMRAHVHIACRLPHQSDAGDFAFTSKYMWLNFLTCGTWHRWMQDLKHPLGRSYALPFMTVWLSECEIWHITLREECTLQ
jgi:hypothetical protein